MKKIIVLSSNRADYYKLEPIIDSIYNNKKTQLYLIVTGCHLLKDYGNTYKNIKYPIFKKINTLINVEGSKMISESIGFSMLKFTSVVEDIIPDYVILHGDRFDILGMSNVCLSMNIPIIHIEGGELSGCIDNTIRDIVSLTSKYHIVSSVKAKKRLEKLLNNSNNIEVMGCPIIDKYVNYTFTKQKWNNLIEYLNINLEYNNYIVMIYHIDSVYAEQSKTEYIKLYNILKTLNKKIICFYPNIDNCTKDTIRYIDNNKSDNIILLKNLELNLFQTLLYKCSLFIGNSSSLVREAPIFNIPTILIGKRQNNRQLYESTIAIEEINDNELLNTINEIYGKKYTSELIYGEGNFTKNFNDFINKIIL